MILTINQAHFRYGADTVFCNVSCNINDGERIGLVGKNGCGKSTLLQCIVNKLQLFEGSIVLGSNVTVGYLTQNQNFESNQTVYESLLKVFDYERNLLEQADKLSKQLSVASGQEYKQLAERYDRVHNQIISKDAYNIEVKVNTVINGMGLNKFKDNIANTLSGGEKTKVALCKLLLEQPDLLILDEPTNHLDYKTLDWLEGYLSSTKCALLIVSHDRYFLDKLCNKIWCMEGGTVYSYNGNYTQFVALREQFVERQTKLYEQQQKEIAKLTDYIARNKVRASTANMAKSREKMLERMEIVDKPLVDAIPPKFQFDYTTDSVEKVLNVHNLTVQYDNRKVLDNCELDVVRGDKIAIMGLNGTGKSTLIKHIMAYQTNIATVIMGKNVRMGYYDQENSNLDKTLSVMDELWFNYSRMSQTEVRSRLAQVGFVGEDVKKTVSQLSGGERAKLGLAILCAGDNNLLVLDEPTNHLDLQARQSLESALISFGGTIVFVSHDRYFVNRIANKVAELEKGKLTVYKGNYEQFVEAKRSMSAQSMTQNITDKQATAKAIDSAKNSEYRNKKQRAQAVNTQNKLKQIEQQITALENEEQSVNEQLMDKSVQSNYELLNSYCERLAEIKNQLEQLFEQWESLQQQ